MKQPELIQPEQLAPRLRWEKLFQFLPAWPQPSAKQGRKPIDRNSLLKALIYQRLARKRFLRDLHTHLVDSPPMQAALGFNPYQQPPSLERFSSFLSDCPNQLLQTIRNQLTQKLISNGTIAARHVGLDSCPIVSWVKENNLKTRLNYKRYDKTSIPKADPDARLGVRIHFPDKRVRKVHYFWGYRNHTLVDLETELSIWEITEPNNIHELTVAIPLLDLPAACFDLSYESVCADTEYDVEGILKHIILDFNAEAFIPRNPRNTTDKSGFQRQGENVICPGGLQMYRRGRGTTKGITYVQYSCPFFYGKRPDLLFCPVDHPKFTRKRGCHYMWRLTNQIRDRIPYGTKHFKEQYNRRSALERNFSRLLAITLEEPAVRGLSSVRNHCTISHIAVLLVALAAHELGYTDKIRFARTFVPRFLSSDRSPNTEH